MNITGAQRKRRQWLLVGDPTVLVLALSVVQLARDVVALLRERSTPPEIRVLMIRRGRQGD
jgi:hypothetical protein